MHSLTIAGINNCNKDITKNNDNTKNIIQGLLHNISYSNS